jgi:TRAP-type C4-dicarboxylate transport system permease small subunit
MIGFIFLGGASVAHNDGHIRMDVLARLLPLRFRIWAQLISEALLIVTSVALVIFAIPTIRQLYRFDQRSVAADVPIFIPQSAIPIGLSAMALIVVFRLLSGRWRESFSGPSH